MGIFITCQSPHKKARWNKKNTKLLHVRSTGSDIKALLSMVISTMIIVVTTIPTVVHGDCPITCDSGHMWGSCGCVDCPVSGHRDPPIRLHDNIALHCWHAGTGYARRTGVIRGTQPKCTIHLGLPANRGKMGHHSGGECVWSVTLGRLYIECSWLRTCFRRYYLLFPWVLYMQEGQYMDKTEHREGSCKDCQKGRFQTKTGQSSCELCPSGKYDNVEGRTSDQCESCSEGQYVDGTGRSQCTGCAAGQYVDTDGAASCSACERGRFASGTGNTECIVCQAGKYQPNTQQSSCKECPSGKYDTVEERTSDQCGNCSQGHFASGTGNSVCKECQDGYFQNDEGKTSCKVCSTASGTGNTQCGQTPTSAASTPAPPFMESKTVTTSPTSSANYSNAASVTAFATIYPTPSNMGTASDSGSIAATETAPFMKPITASPTSAATVPSTASVTTEVSSPTPSTQAETDEPMATREYSETSVAVIVEKPVAAPTPFRTTPQHRDLAVLPLQCPRRTVVEVENGRRQSKR